MIPRSRQHETNITATSFELREHQCVYSHHIPDMSKPGEWTLFYIGCCKLCDVLKSPDAFKNSYWRSLINDGIALKITIAFTSDSYIECNTMQAQMIAALRPIANTQGFITSGSAVVTCMVGPNTGKSYATQQLAAIDNGISQPTLSNHLNGRPGYEIVRGMKFKRGM